MSMIVKAGAGLVAGVVAGALGLAFFPRMERNALTPRAAVEKPQFVATAPAAKTASPVVQATTAAPVPAAVSPAQPSPSPVALASLTPPTKPAPAPAPATPAKAPAPVAASASPAAAPAATPDAGSTPWSVRGLVALARGDLSSARVYLIRAAEAGDPRAFVALADTYDPAMLIKLGVIGAPGDAQRARDYLAKAAAAGVVAAKDRIAALEQNAH